jgi:phytoene synthase
VVGLVCIRVFGYRDPAAEPLAEKCGVAFQLTNILRDVREDAQMGRIYLPAEDLARFERSADGLSAQSLRNGFQPDLYRPLLEFEAARAREFYAAAGELLKLIDEESRPALWVLVEIYRRLLEKITRLNYDVFTQRVQLGRMEKLSILSRGLLRRLL